MYLLGLGLVLLAMKYFEFGPGANLSWLWVFAPFGLAVLWWWWADSSGFTKRRAMERENERRNQRIQRNREALGTASKSSRRK